MIGVLTMVIGDLASHFGCTVGLTDAVTAITFVALGTSLPGKFSKNFLKATLTEAQVWGEKEVRWKSADHTEITSLKQ